MNKAILIGRVGQEPKIRQLHDGTLSTFSLATEEKWKNKQGEYMSRTTWHNLQAWRNMKFLRKGMLIAVEGRIDYREKDGKYFTNIIVDKVDILDWNKKDTPESSPTSSNGFPRLTDKDFRDKNQPF